MGECKNPARNITGQKHYNVNIMNTGLIKKLSPTTSHRPREIQPPIFKESVLYWVKAISDAAITPAIACRAAITCLATSSGARLIGKPTDP
jgi:hypothetical protein